MSRNLFLIDDADFMVDMLRMILEDAGYRVVGSATDSLKALDELTRMTSNPKGERVDIVIVDLHMPKLNGFMAIEKLRAILPQAKILLVSANSTFPVVMKARELKVDGFVVKPFEPDTLLAEVRKLC